VGCHVPHHLPRDQDLGKLPFEDLQAVQRQVQSRSPKLSASSWWALETSLGGIHTVVLYLMGFSHLPTRRRLNRRFRLPPATRTCKRGTGSAQCLPWQPDGRSVAEPCHFVGQGSCPSPPSPCNLMSVSVISIINLNQGEHHDAFTYNYKVIQRGKKVID